MPTAKNKTSRKTPAKSKAPKRLDARRRSSRVVLLVATRKGAWLYHSDAARRSWRVAGPHFFGHIVYHCVLDPRDRRTLLVAARTGHLGPTVFRSADLGKTWKEASRPPAFPKAAEGETGRVVDHVFWLTPSNGSEPATWYAGTSPQGLFRSADGGDTWDPVSGLNDHPEYRVWMGGPHDGTPDGPKLHSIIVDPRDASHLYLGMSSGGVHESTDGGRHWHPLIKGLEVVENLNPSDVSQHDPHCVRLCPSNPDRLYQQNHCGIYRIDRPSDQWVRVGRSMPKTVGDVGFPMVLHPRDQATAWVFPMDGTDVWPRTSPRGKPAAYVTRNGGNTWKRLDAGLPQRDAWYTVKRQAMTSDACDPVGLYFGTTSGDVWASRNEGTRWTRIAQHLPHIYALEAAEIG
ncbi:MAG TPA: hypothetical protein VMT89_14230 [Candidatus Acidoferrales bacterium]|nr:hypothetical protein [Candidatus Acidoferrales bacterium]